MNFSKLKIVFNILHMFQHLAFHHFPQTFFYINHNLVSILHHKIFWSFLTNTTTSWSCYNTRHFLFFSKNTIFHLSKAPISIREWHRFENIFISIDLKPIFKNLCQFLKFISEIEWSFIHVIPIKDHQCCSWMTFIAVINLAHTISITPPHWWSRRTAPGGEQTVLLSGSYGGYSGT